MSDYINETKSLLIQDLQIDFSNTEQSEEAILKMIALRVAEMMVSDFDLLLSYLYRLDVEESKINFILNQQSTVPPDLGLATLIWERQKQRIKTKKEFGNTGMIDGWEF